MATDREMRKHQEEMLFENFLAQEMLAANKTDQYKKYLKLANNKAKSGMTAEEIDAVHQRAKESAIVL
jgi:hypothetical protein